MTPPQFPADWKITGQSLVAETVSSRIWRVSRLDGATAVVKDLKPFDDVEDELRGAQLLAWRQGEGLVRLYGVDGLRMLVEDAGTRHLSEVIDGEGDDAATMIAAETMARLHSPSDRPAPPGLQPLAERFRSLFARATADRRAGRASLYVEAAGIAQRLLDGQRDVRPLHGDLHHDNIMQGPRGWLAIDPKGVMGDPGFDAANLFYNPLDRDGLCRSDERIAFMAHVFADTLQQDAATVLDHAVGYGCLSAAWHAEDGNALEEQRELSIAEAIRRVRARL